MLKPYVRMEAFMDKIQPPLGGCVLKQTSDDLEKLKSAQPPLGGCVLKHREKMDVSRCPISRL